MNTKQESFRAAYALCLARERQAHPEEYQWPIEDLHDIVTRMIDAMTRGTAHIGLAAKKAAKMVGCPPTAKGIREYLGGGNHVA